MASPHVLNVTDTTYQAEVIDSSVPVLVDFWANWCGPCKMMAPALDQLATEMDGKIKVAKVDVDVNQKYAGSLGVNSIPALFLYKNGEIVDRVVGAQSKQRLQAMVTPHL